MGKIHALCTSEQKGTLKKTRDKVSFATEWGIKGDAHAGKWHRQVSFLGLQEIVDFRKSGAQVELGAFGENIVAEGIRFKDLPVGTRLRSGEVWFEITQIGKECHKDCAIRQQVGDCIMPREGIFGRVLHGGEVSVGDELEIVPNGEKLPLEAAVITASDKGSRGERVDESGAKAAEILTANGYTVVKKIILPDEQEQLEDKMLELAERGIALIATTGGTGFSPRDITPEATLAVCERLAPGIPEAMRALSLKITNRAMLSRAQAGICRRSLIVNLPGSKKAVEECLGFILPPLKHGIDILRGETGECGRLQ
jgi:molybdenum cofactor synthesis domain-containing protein